MTLIGCSYLPTYFKGSWRGHKEKASEPLNPPNLPLLTGGVVTGLNFVNHNTCIVSQVFRITELIFDITFTVRWKLKPSLWHWEKRYSRYRVQTVTITICGYRRLRFLGLLNSFLIFFYPSLKIAVLIERIDIKGWNNNLPSLLVYLRLNHRFKFTHAND